MKNGFFLKLALSNIHKNRRFFIPRILAETGLLCVFFIVLTLKNDERIGELRGGEYIATFMSIGVAVMMLLSAILLFYTNSFLMKQRKREFGVYNILGLEKRHITRILFHETFVCSALSMVLGLGCGLLFYKLCSLLICRLLQAEVVLGFYFFSLENLALPALFFLAVDLLTYGANCMSIARLKPVELLSAANTGEREPRVKWPLLVLGIVALTGGYYISITTESPLQAISLFFVAVILVIIGTYFLFVSGSIFVLKGLKKNKRFYYNKSRMPAVSGLLYRMKQNAVGLASITILATGVLVMISTTVSLYAGMQETLDNNFPQQYYISADYYTQSAPDAEAVKHSVEEKYIAPAVELAAQQCGLKLKSLQQQEYLTVSYVYENGTMICRRADGNLADNLKGLAVVTYVTEEMYRTLGGQPLNLETDEIAVCPMDIRQSDFSRSQLSIGEDTYRVKTVLPIFPVRSDMDVTTINCYGVVVADETVLQHIFRQQQEAYGTAASEMTRQAAAEFMDLEKACKVGYTFKSHVEQNILHALREEKILTQEQDNWLGFSHSALWDTRDNMMGMNGSLLFLGIILGLVCLFATALIVYYKQISEGYEDRSRFQIIQKVGMSRREVKKTINTQVLLVFFLPLLVAGIHLVFAFPILEKLLHILLLSSTKLFVLCALITFGVFAGVYVLIYLATARTYYKIVR